tara:strand:+ start:4996 stop:5967 length:972 start_codon:yes stop_codon:yes gene_type:complete
MIEKVVIIGLGQIAFGYDLNRRNSINISSHANAFSKHENFEIVAGIDISFDRRKAFSEAYETATYEKVDKQIANLNPSVVVISTPTETHADILEDILSYIKPKIILCEKPLDFSYEKAKKMVNSCRKNEVKLFVNYMRQSDISTRSIFGMIQNETIKYPIKANVWYSKGIYNTASHLMNLLEFWLGPQIEEKIINVGEAIGNHDFDPDFAVKYKNGYANFISAKEDNFSIYTIELVAQNGRLYYSNGGEKITWQCSIEDEMFEGYYILDEKKKNIENNLHQSQMNVVNEISNFISNKEYFICEADEALQTINNVNKIMDLIER